MKKWQLSNKERFDQLMENVVIDRNTGCWIWTGAIISSGYGCTWFQKKVMRAHRVFYEIIKGSIPEDLELDHLCRIRRCVNPEHLEPVSRSENLLRSSLVGGDTHSRRTHCLRGHEFNLSNTYLYNGKRHCRECRASYSNRSRKK